MEVRAIITVKEARKLLGKDAESLSDDQVQEIIVALKVLANRYLGNTGSRKA